MIDQLHYCFRQEEIQGRKSKFSSRCTFVQIGTQERWLNQQRAEVQPPKQKMKVLCCYSTLLGNEGTGVGGRLGCLRVIIQGTIAQLTPLPTRSVLSRQEQMSLFFLKLLHGLTPPPTKSNLATAGTSVSRSSESQISKMQLLPKPEYSLSDIPHKLSVFIV